MPDAVFSLPRWLADRFMAQVYMARVYEQDEETEGAGHG